MRIAITEFLLIALVSVSVWADPPLLRNDSKRPVEKISHDLGVKPEQFIACFNDVHPASQGAKPSRERVHSNKAILLPCLQKANPGITNEKLDAVMDRFRPGGHEAQAAE